MAEKVTLWCLDESLRDYSRRLDGVEVRYLVGKRLALSFVDAERPAAGGGYRAAHRYTVTFSQGFRALPGLPAAGLRLPPLAGGEQPLRELRSHAGADPLPLRDGGPDLRGFVRRGAGGHGGETVREIAVPGGNAVRESAVSGRNAVR